MENKRILVIGGSGYIGREIVPKLIKQDNDVTIMSRYVKTSTQFKTIRGSVLNKALLENIIGHFDLVIYLAAVIRTIKKDLYLDNVTGLRNLIEVMQKKNKKRIIYFSTQNIYIDHTGPYGDSKKLCESILLSSQLDYIIIRPNYVYGIDKNNDLFKLVYLIKKFKVCPIIGAGKTFFEPINKVDLAKFFIEVLINFTPRTIIDFSGPKSISIIKIIDIIENQLMLRCSRIHIPLRLLKPIKYFIPFDWDGINNSRISINPYPGKHTYNIEKDLIKINNLV